jgi:hypothetical protein
MGWKLSTVLVGATAVAGLVVAAPSAFGDEDEAHGGQCGYGDFSVNVQPSCDTTRNGGGGADELLPTLQPLQDVSDQGRPFLVDARPAFDDLRPTP